MVLNNVTVSSDFENIGNLPPFLPTALSLWHYHFEVRFEDTLFKVL